MGPDLTRLARLSPRAIAMAIRATRTHGLKPHLVKTFKISHDVRFAEKLNAIVGLYLNPPEHAIVFVRR